MNSIQHILLTGGQGKTSSRIALSLLTEGYHVRVAGRRTISLQHPQAQSVFFDWNDTTTYTQALQNIDAVYIVVPVMMNPEILVVPFIEQALTQGIQRIVLLSSASISIDDPVFGYLHRWISEHVPQWAVLRPSYFMQNFTEAQQAQLILEQGIVSSATGDGKIGFVDADDIAKVAVHALTDTISHNTEHIITGPQSLTYAEVATLITEVTGLPVTYHPISESQLEQHLVHAGLDPKYASFLAHLDTQIAVKGTEDRVSDCIEKVTGHPPKSLRQYIQEHQSLFVNTAKGSV